MAAFYSAAPLLRRSGGLAPLPAAIVGLNATVHTNKRTIAGDDFFGAIRIHDPEYRVDHGPIEDGCDCPFCGAGLTRAYLHHLFKVGDAAAERYATLHNLNLFLERFGQRQYDRVETSFESTR